jgi:hypothetical protein
MPQSTKQAKVEPGIWIEGRSEPLDRRRLFAELLADRPE